MNRDNNITNINEYRENMMPGGSGFDINEPNYQVEFVSDELLNSYLTAVGNDTPDLWGRIEAGFEAEAKDVIRERKRKSARAWKTLGYVAAAVLITIIAIPVMKLGMGGEKSEDTTMMTESATAESYEEMSDSVAMEALAEDIVESGVENESAMTENMNNVITGDSQSAQADNTESDMVAVKGIQTDARQLVVQGEFIFDDEADIIKFHIKMINDNHYEDVIIEVGDEITLSNPLYVKTMDFFIIETEITLDSVNIDNAGNLTGRIIDLDLQGWDIEKEYIED